MDESKIEHAPKKDEPMDVNETKKDVTYVTFNKCLECSNLRMGKVDIVNFWFYCCNCWENYKQPNTKCHKCHTIDICRIDQDDSHYYCVKCWIAWTQFIRSQSINQPSINVYVDRKSEKTTIPSKANILKVGQRIEEIYRYHNAEDKIGNIYYLLMKHSASLFNLKNLYTHICLKYNEQRRDIDQMLAAYYTEYPDIWKRDNK